MGFAYIRYGEETKNTAIGKEFIKYFGNSKIKSIENFEKVGFDVKLPYCCKEQDLHLISNVNRRLFNKLEKMGINAVAADDFINVPTCFEKSDGRYINAYFAKEIVEDTAILNGINIDEAEIVVRDGGDDESLIAILQMAEFGGRISICSDRGKYIEPYLEKIFNETGLCIGCFSDEYGKPMTQADIILNCVGGSERNKCYKKDVVYIGLFSAQKYLDELYNKRHDMKIYGCPIFQKNEVELKNYVAEAAVRDWCIDKNRDFRDGNFRQYTLSNGIKYIKSYFVMQGVK